MEKIAPYIPIHKVRIVTAASLFDGHDAALNIMRRIIQATGCEVIHLGHDRSVEEVVDTAIQEDAQAIAMTSYQGGHMEYFKFMHDLLKEKGAPHIKIFGGGGGTILPEEIRELQEDCMSFLITKMDRYDPSKGARAFAFFGTIAKHYLMGEKKISYKNIQTNLSLEDQSVEFTLIDIEEDKEVEKESENVNVIVFNEIVEKLEKELDNPKILSNDKKVMEAIVYIFKRHEVINIYNKNLLYHLIKERTDLQPKEITYSLTRLRDYYKIFKQDFLKKIL
jgi:methylmalonyl-CoA mutase cobalamin-binding domain/chain